MIKWLYGNSCSGKTTRAKEFIEENNDNYNHHILLDGDQLRAVWPGLGYTKEDRWEQNLRVARLARTLEQQGFDVVVAVIAPYIELRKEIHEICGCEFEFVPGGKSGPDYPFER